jgi:hypothetical protein
MPSAEGRPSAGCSNARLEAAWVFETKLTAIKAAAIVPWIETRSLILQATCPKAIQRSRRMRLNPRDSLIQGLRICSVAETTPQRSAANGGNQPYLRCGLNTAQTRRSDVRPNLLRAIGADVQPIPPSRGYRFLGFRLRGEWQCDHRSAEKNEDRESCKGFDHQGDLFCDRLARSRSLTDEWTGSSADADNAARHS